MVEHNTNVFETLSADLPTFEYTMPTISKAKAKRLMNERLHKLGLIYHDGLPISAISAIVDDAGFDSEVLNGIYCGAEGRVNGSIGNNLYINMTWYKMPSGRYEVVAYIS